MLPNVKYVFLADKGLIEHFLSKWLSTCYSNIVLDNKYSHLFCLAYLLKIGTKIKVFFISTLKF